ncbi:MAG: DUF1501 domain-containing protein, partial [Bacteroidota bacterium]
MNTKRISLQEEASMLEAQLATRRLFLKQCSMGLGALAFSPFINACSNHNKQSSASLFDAANPLHPKTPHLPGKAKSVIYLHMAGAPSQLELFDYKPELKKLDGQLCPESLLKGKKFAFIRGVPKMLGTIGEFKQRGQSGAWVSHYLPHLAGVADELSFLKAVHTD